MAVGDHVHLDRTFSPLHAPDKDAEDYEFAVFVEGQEPIDWLGVEKNHCAVILAGAGIGKTHEMKRRAEVKRKAGAAAFFIRIEDIDKDFTLSFEVGDEAAFEAWVSSVGKAWFYLDSIDEARLSDPRMFEKAIRCFARKIKDAQHRAHIVISSRPYAWRSRTDHMMVEKHLHHVRQMNKIMEPENVGELTEEKSERANETTEAKCGLRVYVLNDLTETDIRVFARVRGVADEDILVENIQRRDLFAVAARPYDLESIIAKWKKDGELGSRLDFLRFGIEERLLEINPDRDRQQPLNRQKARAGARLLAAAVILTGKPGIRVPDEQPLQDGIDAAAVLGDWKPDDVHALLERGIFDDVIYGMVRFRHREIRELLAAEWLAELLRTGNSRRDIECLIFREKYGHTFITSRLRPVLPWLIVFDKGIRRKAVSLSPEIISEGGDPSQLLLEERRKILKKLVARIVDDVGFRSANENDAIARIAEPDLSDEVLLLLDKHRENDSALYFLGRLVWQGAMTACVKPMAEIAVDSGKGPYVRIAAVRAVATVGSREEFDAVWDGISADESPVEYRVAAEIVRNASLDHASINKVLAMFERLTPHERFQTTCLSNVFHRFLDRFEVDQADGQQEVARLIEALNHILSREPCRNGRGGGISEKRTLLLNTVARGVERLVSVKSPHALSDNIVTILRKVYSGRNCHDFDFRGHVNHLKEAVPEWSELNDFVFWSMTSEERKRCEETGDSRPVNPSWVLNHSFCRYKGADFDRVLSFIPQREHDDDKLVAVELAHHLFNDFELPDEAMNQIRDSAKGNQNLTDHLEGLVNWRRRKRQRATDKRSAKARRKRDRKSAVATESRCRWIERLKANPSLVLHPKDADPGEMTRDQLELMKFARKGDNTRWGGDDWRILVDTFGEKVSAAYRDAGINYWRHYTPALARDGNDLGNLIFGLAGLEMEAEQVADFPENLSGDELRLAMRYVPWERHGFPTWLKKAYYNRREIVSDALLCELAWDLEREKALPPYILQHLVYHAPWLHAHIADWVIDWLEKNSARDADVLRMTIFISKSTANKSRLTALARTKSEAQGQVAEQAKWFALWVDIDADEAIGCLEEWLSSLSPTEASTAAQHFITELIGSRYDSNLVTGFDSYRKPAHLKHLFGLMHVHIREEQDINREGGSAYSPGLRDNAQKARDGLFQHLCDIPGKETYLAIRELEEKNPNDLSRTGLLRLAFERAKWVGDIEDWSDDQLREFDSDQSMTPTTNTQLFSLTVQRLIDIKMWLESGDDSPYQTWQRPETETEMRNLFTGRLNELANGQYSCAQENEMPNAQRPDIRVQMQGITPVPIELKILDNGWTGPKLCERLRNQLAGDYLRDKGGGRGVMLLVWQGRKPEGKRKIDKCLVGLNDLEEALQNYWHSIAQDWPNVEEVKIIVVNLVRRGQRSNT